MTKKRIQAPPTVAMRLNAEDKRALRELSAHHGKSQTETVRVLVRGRLASYYLSERTRAAFKR